MKFKQVFSQVLGCSYGNIPEMTQSCERCSMRLTASNEKIYVPEDQAVPVSAAVDHAEIKAGAQAVFTVTYSASVKKKDIKVIPDSQLELVSVVAGSRDAGEVVKVTVKAKEGAIPGLYALIVTYKHVNRIVHITIQPTPPGEEPELELHEITLDKDVLEVGETTRAVLSFTEKDK